MIYNQMKGLPHVSVVIPVFNRAGSLRRSISSALAQTHQDLEVIVVDDGSTDHISALVHQLKDPRLRWERHEINRGAAAARNTGIRAASGRWIAFLDSDDEWLPNKLEVQLAHLSSSAPETLGVCCGYFLHNGAQPAIEKVGRPEPSSWHRHLLLGCDLGPGTTLLVARECFHKIGFLDEQFKRFEDWEWLLRFVKSFRLGSVPEPLARVYRERHVAASAVEESTLRLVSMYREEARQYGRLFERKFLARRWLHLAWLFFSEGGVAQGTNYLLRALWQEPTPSPGMILLILDAILKTRLAPRATAWRATWTQGLRRLWL